MFPEPLSLWTIFKICTLPSLSSPFKPVKKNIYSIIYIAPAHTYSRVWKKWLEKNEHSELENACMSGRVFKPWSLLNANPPRRSCVFHTCESLLPQFQRLWMLFKLRCTRVWDCGFCFVLCVCDSLVICSVPCSTNWLIQLFQISHSEEASSCERWFHHLPLLWLVPFNGALKPSCVNLCIGVKKKRTGHHNCVYDFQDDSDLLWRQFNRTSPTL